MTLSRSLYRSFGALLALLLFLTGFSLFNFRRLGDADAWKVHTYQVMQSIHRLSSQLDLMDSGVRGFIIEKTPETVELYEKASRDSEAELADLEKLTSDRTTHRAGCAKLEAMRQKWIENSLEPILAMRRSTTDDFVALQQSAKYAPVRRHSLIEMQGVLDGMETVENDVLKTRTADQRHWQDLTQITLWAGSIFSVLLTCALAVLVSGASKKLDIANARLVHSNAQLADTNAQIVTTNARLSDEIGQRRAAEAKLLQTVTELERSNAELEQFAYVASHDLQEPLRAVAGCVQVLKKRYAGQLDARADQFIEHAVEGAQRMQNLINDLLSYSRVGTRGKAFEMVNLEKVFSRARQNISEAVNDAGAEITHDPLPELRGDSGQLEQVLQNLMSNGIKFRGEAAPQVHVSYRLDGDSHVFGVRDNGLGIEPQYFERIFVMFQRLHTRAEYPGTGIGLAICKKIVERHGGKIWVDSEPGQGTTFWFSVSAHLGENADELGLAGADGGASNGIEANGVTALPLAAGAKSG